MGTLEIDVNPAQDMKVIFNNEPISQVNGIEPLNRVLLSLVGVAVSFTLFNGGGTPLKAQALSETEAAESKSQQIVPISALSEMTPSSATGEMMIHSPLTVAQSSNISFANDKYYNRSQVLNCPQDQGEYGNFYDYGYWEGGSWCGQTGKAGYWVWVNPNWYVWQDVVPKNASANGSYSNLVQVLNCPTDRGRYGDYNNYGYWEGGSWCGQTGKAGYWTWVYPNWYVWENKN